MKIIDSFLPQQEFELAACYVLGEHFPWFFNDAINGPERQQPKPDNDLINYQFIHRVYYDDAPQSNAWEFVRPILERIGYLAVLRAKFNLNPIWATNECFGLHADNNRPTTSALLYFNDNNGSTIFEDGTVVEAKANRLVLFDSQIRHSGFSTTNQKRRVVFNAVFIAN